MNTNVFVSFVLTMTCAMTYLYAELREYFNPLDTYKDKVTRLEEKIKREIWVVRPNGLCSLSEANRILAKRPKMSGVTKKK